MEVVFGQQQQQQQQQQQSKSSAAEQLMWEEFPLHRCCRDGDAAALYQLVTSGSHSIFTEDSFHGWTPVHWAAHFGHARCLQTLVLQTSLAKSCDIQVSGTRQTPLHVAAESGATDAIGWLVRYGADVNQKDYLGETALHKAARSGSLDSIDLLTDAGGRCNIKNLRGETAFDLAQTAPAKSFLYQLLRTSQNSEAIDDSDMDDACDYHNSVNIPRTTAPSFILPTHNSITPTHPFISPTPAACFTNRAKRPRTADDENFTKRARLSVGDGDFVPNLSFLFGGQSPADSSSSASATAYPSPTDAFPTAADASPSIGGSSCPDALVGNVGGRNGFHDGDESIMKTISSRINGDHAAASLSSSSSTEEEETEMEETDGFDAAFPAAAAAAASHLPKHLIPPLPTDHAASTALGLPMGMEMRMDNGKPGRSKCVWFRSSCYI